jgi:hypothetical protein
VPHARSFYAALAPPSCYFSTSSFLVDKEDHAILLKTSGQALLTIDPLHPLVTSVYGAMMLIFSNKDYLPDLFLYASFVTPDH